MGQDRSAIKFGHLELTMPRGSLTKEACEDIDKFWCGVFGWNSDEVNYPEFDNLVQHRLHADGQAIILTEADDPMILPRQPVGMGPGQTVAVPHLGLLVGNLDELERLLDECQRYQRSDPRVQLWDSGERRYPGHGGLHHAFLVRFILPMWFDVYATRWDEGLAPPLAWRFLPDSDEIAESR